MVIYTMTVVKNLHILANLLQVGYSVNSFQPGLEFHIETSHLICCASEMTSFYMKCHTRLKWIKNNVCII